MSSPQKFARVSAMLGALLWCLTLPFRTGDSFETDLIQKIFLLAAFVIVPLGLSFLGIKQEELSLRIALWMQPFAAVCVLVSFVLDQGPIAGVLAAVWLVDISFIALGGLLRGVFSIPRQANELIIDVGLTYLPVGGAWLFASRIGFQPMGFGDTIVLLTAVHFHYAGFAAPVLTGLAGRWLRDVRYATNVRYASACRPSPPQTFADDTFSKSSDDKLKHIGHRAHIGQLIAGFMIIAGTPIVAAGITASPLVALAGTLTVALGLALLGVITIIFVVPSLKSILARVFLTIASLSSLAAMVLAILYAYSIVTQTLILNIPQMAKTHGLLNSFGFALCGLLAWLFNEPMSDEL